ncbi:hypothetical protein BC829DRAFT_388633 [Chytridium lagenaria]|nr:hypothetical protein BC829DRAFT_388633 [Chytridium lagenaria]
MDCITDGIGGKVCCSADGVKLVLPSDLAVTVLSLPTSYAVTSTLSSCVSVSSVSSISHQHAHVADTGHVTSSSTSLSTFSPTFPPLPPHHHPPTRIPKHRRPKPNHRCTPRARPTRFPSFISTTSPTITNLTASFRRLPAGRTPKLTILPLSANDASDGSNTTPLTFAGVAACLTRPTIVGGWQRRHDLTINPHISSPTPNVADLPVLAILGILPTTPPAAAAAAVAAAVAAATSNGKGVDGGVIDILAESESDRGGDLSDLVFLIAGGCVAFSNAFVMVGFTPTFPLGPSPVVAVLCGKN